MNTAAIGIVGCDADQWPVRHPELMLPGAVGLDDPLEASELSEVTSAPLTPVALSDHSAFALPIESHCSSAQVDATAPLDGIAAQTAPLVGPCEGTSFMADGAFVSELPSALDVSRL